jgi:hypothetical protein
MKSKLLLQLITVASMTFSSASVFGQLSGYYQEDFEGAFPPDGWKVVNVLDPAYGWQQSPYTVYSGNYSVYNGSAIGQGEDWLILPKFTVAASDSFSFWFTAESLGFTDTTQVLVSTTTDDLSSFTTVLATLSDGENYPPVANLYQYYAYSLSAFAGQDIYVALKNRNLEGDGVYVDLFSIGSLVATGFAESNTVQNVEAAYPNPFSTSTYINIKLTKPADVRVSIFDAMGKEISILCNANLPSGLHQIRWNAAKYPAGIYFSKIVVDKNVSDSRLMKIN